MEKQIQEYQEFVETTNDKVETFETIVKRLAYWSRKMGHFLNFSAVPGLATRGPVAGQR